MIKKQSWVNFEKLVAAIHYTETSGAKVKWNEIIKGRQFDVTIRFRFGLHEYLTVIECKDYSDKVPVEKVDAFVTKSLDVNAEKAIMISKNGFQSGCQDVAQKHGIKLLTLKEKYDPKVLSSELSIALNIDDIHFFLKDSKEPNHLTRNRPELQYLAKHTIIKYGNNFIPLEKLIQNWQINLKERLPTKRTFIKLILPENSSVKIPDSEDIYSIDAIGFYGQLVDAIILPSKSLDASIVEKTMISYDFINIDGGIEHSIPEEKIKYGFDTIIQEDQFYRNPKLGFYYYCKDICNDLVEWILIESFQHGHLVQVEFTQSTDYSDFYVEVSDNRTLARLKKRLVRFLNNKKIG
jgi:hypothetical protein